MKRKLPGLCLSFLLVCVCATAARAAETLNFTMGAVSGSVYALGVQLGEQLRKNGDYIVNVKAGGAQGNVLLVDRNRAQVGHTSTGLAASAFKGEEPYTEKAENIRGIAKVMDSTFQFVVLDKTPVASIEEIKTKKYPLKIAVGPRGRENELLTRRIFASAGITYEDITAWGGRVEYVEMGDAASLIRDGHLEAVTILSGIPYGPVAEINATRPIRILSLDDAVVESLGDKYGYTPATVPGGTYKDVSGSAKTVAGGVIIFVHKDVSDEVAAGLTQAICSDEGRKNIGNLSGSIRDYLKTARDGSIGVGIPLHPAAKKWYEENAK